MKIESEQAAATKGKQLTPEEQKQLQAEIAKEMEAQTPPEVKKYMARDHQDPAEVMMHQILEYLIQEQEVINKFNQGFKHSLLAGEEIYHIGIFNGKPGLTVVNNLRFQYDTLGGEAAIEDGQWATCEYRWSPAEVVSKLGSELTPKEIDRLYQYSDNPGSSMTSADFDWGRDGLEKDNTIDRQKFRKWGVGLFIGAGTVLAPTKITGGLLIGGGITYKLF